MNQSATMRMMAERYEELARSAATAGERERFNEYVRLYREMEEHFTEAERAADRDLKR